MKRYLHALLAGVAMFSLTLPALAEDTITIGAIMSPTGGLADFTPAMRDGVRAAIQEVNDAGGVRNNKKIKLSEGDDQTTPQGAVDVATRLIQVEKVPLIIGPMTSSGTIAVANSVSVPAGVPIISESASAPSIANLDDKDLVFRTAVADDLQGKVLASAALKRGIKSVAVLALNNDYGTGMQAPFEAAFKAGGGTITYSAAYEPDRPAYRTELAAAAGAGKADALVVLGFASSGGVLIVRQALEGSFFNSFVFADAMREDILLNDVGADYLKTSFGAAPVSTGDPSSVSGYDASYKKVSSFKSTSPFAPQSYDAAALAALALEKAASLSGKDIAAALRDVSSPPGETIHAGELAKGLELIRAGKKINYEGASGPVNFDANGDAEGQIGLWEVDSKGFSDLGIYHQ